MSQKITPILLLLSIFISSGCIDAKEDKFEEKWSDSSNIQISRTLVKNNIRGCGEFKYKKNLNYNNEYLVRCTRDGKNWRAYTIYGLSEEILGPFLTNPKND